MTDFRKTLIPFKAFKKSTKKHQFIFYLKLLLKIFKIIIQLLRSLCKKIQLK